MNIRPSLPCHVPSTEANPLSTKRATPADRSDDRPGLASSPAANDQVTVSDAARRLQEGLAVDRPVSLLARGRMEQILDRISHGFYDRSDVRDELLSRIQSDLGNVSLGD